MPSDFHANRGASVSALDWLDRPGQAVRNLLRGNPGAAGRQALDFLGDTADAFLPGDLIPEATSQEDYVSGSELVDIDRKKSPWLALGADLGIGVATDPLTYTGLGFLARGAKSAASLAGKGARSLPGVGKHAGSALDALEQAGTKAGQEVRSIFGAQRLSPEAQAASTAAKGAQSSVGRAVDPELRRIFAGFTPKELEVAGDVVDNRLHAVAGRPVLVSDAAPSLAQRIAAHPDAASLDASRIEKVIRDSRAFMARQGAEGGLGKPLPGVNDMLASGGRSGAESGSLPIFRPGPGTEDYIPRLYKGQTEQQMLDEVLEGQARAGTAAATKERKLLEQDDVAAFLEKNPNLEYVRNLGERVSGRAGQQASMAGKATTGAEILAAVKAGKIKIPDAEMEKIAREIDPKGAPFVTDPMASLSGKMAPAPRDLTKASEYVMAHEFRLADPQSRALVNAAIKGMDPESAKYVSNLFNGIPARSNAFTKTLASVNKVIKPMMVYGYAIPKVGSIVRNKVGGLMQALANPEAAGTVPGQAKRFFSDLYGAVAESIGATDKTALGKDLAAVDAAFSGSGGVAKNAVDTLRKSGRHDLAEMVDSGVLDGFVNSESLVADMARSPTWAKAKSVAEWPGRIFKGVEDRMRAGMYLDLMKKPGMSGSEAARIVRDSLYDYQVSSAGNRLARDLVPFFQFTAKAIPQQAKFLSRGVAQGSPGTALAVAMGNLTPRGNEDPVYPWMEGKVNIPIGQDTQGNAQYISGLGLPVEALGAIPNPSGGLRDLGRDVERTVVGASHPLIKSAYSLISGRDPFFGTQAGTYGKLPVIGEAGQAGRAINAIRGTGLTQPVESLAGTVNMFTDPRKGPGLAALDYLTGAKVESVDPDRALQQQVTRALESNPDVEQYRSFYQKSKDPATQSALHLLQEAKQRLKEKREAEQEKGSVL